MVAIRTVNTNLKPSPLEKLDDACFLFQNAAETSSRALRVLVSTFVLISVITIYKTILTAYTIGDARKITSV
jgi:hypothetical protein